MYRRGGDGGGGGGLPVPCIPGFRLCMVFPLFYLFLFNLFHHILVNNTTFLILKGMFQLIFDHRQLQMSYRTVTKQMLCCLLVFYLICFYPDISPHTRITRRERKEKYTSVQDYRLKKQTKQKKIIDY